MVYSGKDDSIVVENLPRARKNLRVRMRRIWNLAQLEVSKVIWLDHLGYLRKKSKFEISTLIILSTNLNTIAISSVTPNVRLSLPYWFQIMVYPYFVYQFSSFKMVLTHFFQYRTDIGRNEWFEKRNPILSAFRDFLKVFRHFRWVISGESNVMSIFEEI